MCRSWPAQPRTETWPQDAGAPGAWRDAHHRARRQEDDETFETPFVARTNEHRGYITIIEGCDKFCAYCVVPYTRGNERSRSAASVMEEARRMADSGYTEFSCWARM